MRTEGYKTLMGEAKLACDGGDLWGWAQGWAFGLATVAYVRYGHTVEGFEPSPFLMKGNQVEPFDSYPDDMIDEIMYHGEADLEDLLKVYEVISRYVEIIRPTHEY